MNTWIDTALLVVVLLALWAASSVALRLWDRRLRRDAWKHSKIDELPYRSKW